MFQGTMLQYFHWYLPNDGNLWKQLSSEAARLKELGFYTIWLPPASKGTGGGYSVGYDIYDLYDLGEFDQKGSVRTKYGTKEEMVAAIKAVHDAGMMAMVDIVLNHKAGGDETEKISVVKVDEENRNKVISQPFVLRRWIMRQTLMKAGYTGSIMNMEILLKIWSMMKREIMIT